MDSYSIGISGLTAAQKALDVIGNNVANAATDGYHRQRIELTPERTSQVGDLILGGGVDITGITRMLDGLLEREILRQRSSLGQVSQELATLGIVENAFGELSAAGGLSSAIDEFFNALQDLSAHPSELVWQTQVVTAAQTMAGRFRTLGEFLAGLETQVTIEAQNTIEQVNTLLTQIADINQKIQRLEISGGQANNLRDQRDQYITELSELVSVETIDRKFGVVDVCVVGIGVVTGGSATELEVGLKEDGSLGVSIVDAYNYNSDVQGGRLGGLLSLKNDTMAEVHDDLDSLANALIQQINEYHVQAVGSEGSFTELTGWVMPSENLADFDPPVTDGKIYIRVIDTGTGTITRNEISVDASTDSLTTIAAAISAIPIPGLNASASLSKLSITADTGYEFDFLPAVLSSPTASTLTAGTPPTISVSGIYTGTVNDTLRFTVSGAGSVGNGSLELEVTDGGGAGEVIATLNIGQGYAASDLLDVGNGIRISLTAGDFGAGDNFDVDVFADTDTSGVLAAVGINTFFAGSGAKNIAVCSDIVDSPARVATALGADMTDNANVLRLVGLKDQTMSDLDALTPVEFYRQLVTGVGQELSVRQMRQDNVEVIIQNLTGRQSEISGVDINEEATQMLVFEQMFQAMAKYLNVIHSSILTIMEMI
ncbi:MAG TPA: flagellar hook-associated protein FlgK [Sedimentisphaerales bacterium]|nr:flagellar hook-associated protein FlgK [Sedimentisphaerales bacterium]